MGSTWSVEYSLIPECNCIRNTFTDHDPHDFIVSNENCHRIVKASNNKPFLCSNELVIVCKICVIENIEDTVSLMDELFSILLTTENVTDKIYFSIILHKHLISDSQIAKLSRIYNQYAKNYDKYAYAITTLWISIVKAYHVL